VEVSVGELDWVKSPLGRRNRATMGDFATKSIVAKSSNPAKNVMLLCNLQLALYNGLIASGTMRDYK
jgi:hypothetical protein